MLLSKRRVVLFGVIGILVITIILLPRIQYFVNAPDVNAIDFELTSVNVTNLSNNTNNIELLLSFDVSILLKKLQQLQKTNTIYMEMMNY